MDKKNKPESQNKLEWQKPDVAVLDYEETADNSDQFVGFPAS